MLCEACALLIQEFLNMTQADKRDSSTRRRISFFTSDKKIKYEVSENYKIKLMTPNRFVCLQSVLATGMGVLKPPFESNQNPFRCFFGPDSSLSSPGAQLSFYLKGLTKL